MTPPKYHDPSSLSVSAILGDIDQGNIAVPEIQRPFVWRKTQVKKLIDSLFRGYPAGYIIFWQSPKLQAKDGNLARGRKILIDGQQRITALMTAIAGKTIINAEYKPDRIKIAFNPFCRIIKRTRCRDIRCSRSESRQRQTLDKRHFARFQK